MNNLAEFNAVHRVILSCSKSARVLFTKRRRKDLTVQQVTYDGKVIDSKHSAKFLGITFDSALNFRTHYTNIATIARHRLLKLTSIYSSTFGPSSTTLIRLYKSYIRSLFDYGAPATCIASPTVRKLWETVQTKFITRALNIPCYVHNDRKRQHANLTTIHDRNLYLATRWYKSAMQHNSGVQDFITNHAHTEHHPSASSRNVTPLELIRI